MTLIRAVLAVLDSISRHEVFELQVDKRAANFSLKYVSLIIKAPQSNDKETPVHLARLLK